MAFDGFFYRKQTRLLADQLTGMYIDKIYQVGRYDLYLQLKGGGTKRLLLSAQSDQPRILLIDQKPETPAQPTMFTMLLRKHLQSAKISAIKQISLERIVDIDIATKNQIGDAVNYTLRIELMGKHSNIIFVDQNNMVIDAIKRVGENLSIRPIVPNITYKLPPSNKDNLEDISVEHFTKLLRSDTIAIQKALYKHFTGVSPVLATTFCKKAQIAPKSYCDKLSASQLKLLWQAVRSALTELSEKHFWVYRQDGFIKAFSAIDIDSPYEKQMLSGEAYCDALRQFYNQQKSSNQVAQKATASLKRIDALISKITSHIANLEKDLASASDLETYKLYGELLTANLHAVKKGMANITLINYYTNEKIDIPLAIDKAPNENAQYYYKRYNKAKTTLVKAQALIDQNKTDLAYLKQVRSMLECAESAADVDLINKELADGGYLKQTVSKKKQRDQKLPPIKYRSTEGVDILVGRNNYQNDELTMKRADKEHIWLHTKDIAGSHVIITRCFEDIKEQTIVEAAMIAAYHSDARHSSQVPVDLTEVKYVKKPKGAKPGMVIFTDNKTIYVNPDKEKIDEMRVAD